MQSDQKRLEDIFVKMNNDGFDTKEPLKWGFYFFDRDKNKLINVFNELKDHGYKLESIDEMDSNEWRLFVTKVDILTPDKLHRRNIAFNDLAKNCEVALYDGWDVERL